MPLPPLVLTLAAAIAFTPQVDAVGNRFEALRVDAGAVPVPESEMFAAQCTDDKTWCAHIVHDPDTTWFSIEAYDGTQPADSAERWVMVLSSTVDDATFAIWPRIIRTSASATGNITGGEKAFDQVIFGIEERQAASYSGGGASATHLQLIRFSRDPDAVPRTVAELPLNGSATIRACFSKDDMKARRGACADQYDFDADLTLGEPDQGVPTLNLTTRATSFPGKRARYAPAATDAPLTKADIATIADPDCSYARVLHFNPAVDRYEYDAPAPACRDYLVP